MSLHSRLHASNGLDSSVNAAAGSSAPSASQQPALDEVARIRRRRRLARKTPEQRRKLVQYQRRHNEKDERLLYCDYCDLFISARQKTWATHLCSSRHTTNFRAYYDLAAHVESVWLGEIQHKLEVARGREVYRVQQQSAGHGAATPLPTQCVAPGIVVGGTAALAVSPVVRAPPTLTPPMVMGAVATPSIRVGGKVIGIPPAMCPPPPPPSHPQP